MHDSCFYLIGQFNNSDYVIKFLSQKALLKITLNGKGLTCRVNMGESSSILWAHDSTYKVPEGFRDLVMGEGHYIRRALKVLQENRFARN